MQNTGAGRLMASLSPDALSVSPIQPATVTPAGAGALIWRLDKDVAHPDGWFDA